MKLIYNVNDKPAPGQLVVFAFQQVLAIMAATIAVPMIIGHGMSTAAAIFGAGMGTFIYVFFTNRKSPVFLGSSFAFIGSMNAAFAGAVSAQAGYVGLLFGALCAGLVYVVLSVVIKSVGVDWVNKLMPPVVIGPTVAIIGLSLAGNAVGDLQTSSATGEATQWAVLCGLIALFATMIASTYGKKNAKLIPFIIGILAGYAAAAVLTLIGQSTGNTAMVITNFEPLKNIHGLFAMPDFTFLKAFGAMGEVDAA
ncbi:MAG TPA: uracil-xanthine permease, partial [Erysipelotrichaceae bacterium]|nr:uracil-xanthine permease [Erysipelotrichaceae bacterium]